MKTNLSGVIEYITTATVNLTKLYIMSGVYPAIVIYTFSWMDVQFEIEQIFTQLCLKLDGLQVTGSFYRRPVYRSDRIFS